jgi:hypothetical protein
VNTLLISGKPLAVYFNYWSVAFSFIARKSSDYGVVALAYREYIFATNPKKDSSIVTGDVIAGKKHTWT